LNHLEASYLIAPITNFYSKFVEKETNKKYYFLDTGILMLFLNDQDTKLLENQIYIELRRRGFTPYFLKSKLEVDFYVPEENLLIQVSYTISDPETRKREIKALESAMKSLEISESIIITIDEREIIETSSGKIKVIPAFEWLMKE
jgi:predicted AAA+ superfamily ATPase